MTNKVLPGASREALSFLIANWQSLLKMSIIPFAAYALLTLFQVSMLGDLYRQMADMNVNGQLNPAFFATYMRGMALSSLGSLAASMLLGALFVQIIRFQKTGEADWLIRDKAGWMAGVMTYLYGLGMVMLTVVAYFVVALGGMIVAMVLGGLGYFLLGDGVAGAIMLTLFMVAFFVGFLTFLYWFMFRFLVGLPGVALGHSPDFFRDIWPLAKGEGFGLPVRMLFATAVAYVPIAVVAIAFGYLLLGDGFGNLILQLSNDDSGIAFRALADLVDNMGWLFAMTAMLFMPFMWFATLLLGTAFQRFRAKTAQVLK
jgi:hypothetical protein